MTCDKEDANTNNKSFILIKDWNCENYMKTMFMMEGIPEYMHGGIIRYVKHGISGGSFLDAVMCGDYSEALIRADVVNSHILNSYFKMVKNLPPKCHGSSEKVREWKNKGGLEGNNGN